MCWQKTVRGEGDQLTPCILNAHSFSKKMKAVIFLCSPCLFHLPISADNDSRRHCVFSMNIHFGVAVGVSFLSLTISSRHLIRDNSTSISFCETCCLLQTKERLNSERPAPAHGCSEYEWRSGGV